MTKNYISFILLLGSTIIASAQDYLTENFDTATFPPTGWTINQVSGTENWIYNSTAQSAFTDAGSSNIEDTWLITPQLNITANAVLRFKAKADELVPPDNLFIKISTSGTAVADFTTESLAIKVGENVTKNYQEYVVDLKAFTGQSIYIGFHHKTEFAFTDSWGDTYNGASGFYLDDVKVTSTLNKDVALVSLLSPHSGSLAGDNKVSVLIKNTGDIDIPANQLNVSYSIDGGTIVNETVPTELKIGKTMVYDFTNTATIASGSKTVAVTATTTGDTNNANNSKNYTFTFYTDKSLVEDFSGATFLPDGWSSYYISGPYADRLRQNGSTVLIKSTSSNEGNDMLITPKATIENNYILKFSMSAPDYLQYYADNPSLIVKDELVIKISETTNGKTDFTTTVETINLKTHYGAGVYDDTTSKNFTVDLSAYAGKKVYIAFDYANQDGFGIAINTVEIGSQSTLSSQTITNNPLVSVYPNPTTNYLRIANVENAVASLYNINGQQVLTQKISSVNNTIETQQLANGIYLLRINDGTAVISKKIIKK